MSIGRPVIIGAGPAGLAAGDILCAQGVAPVVIEKEPVVGGLSRTTLRQGNRFDIGPHRFYTKNATVLRWWHGILKKDFIGIPRITRIYYRGKYFHYPLAIPDVLAGLGVVDAVRILASYIKCKIAPIPAPSTMEQWTINRFGSRLFAIFFKHYSEKVWGLPCSRISADWSEERIKGFSLSAAMRSAFLAERTPKDRTLIKYFKYPRQGSGEMYEAVARRITDKGGSLKLHSEVVRITHSQGRIQAVIYKDTQSGKEFEEEGSDFCSSMPITDLAAKMDPPAPSEVLRASGSLGYRSLVMVYLVVEAPQLFKDNWVYVHSPDVKVARIQNFKNWSPDMVSNENITTLGMEYFCDENDAFWSLSDKELAQIAQRELEKLRLLKGQKIVDSFCLRSAKAYPVYELGYQEHLEVLKAYLRGFSNLQCIGRYGMFHYNGMEHAVLTGLLAAKNILGAKHDLWSLNMETDFDV